MKQHVPYMLSGGGEERTDASGASTQAKKLNQPRTTQAGRTRPTNNQLLYRAIFHWSHYRRALVEGPRLPDSTEACASVTSAFLQVIAILFDVEKRREIQPRNVLRLLATNTRRTKVVELSSGTHRVPEELKRHSIQDGEGGHYSTNLDRNRYSGDDQYLATVVRYNLDYLDLCPCLVEITILDAKGSNGTLSVTADPCACICNSGVSRMGGPSDARQQRLIRTIPYNNSGVLQGVEEQEAVSKQPEVETHSAKDRTGMLSHPLHTPPASTARPQVERNEPGTWSKNTVGSDRLAALLEVTGSDAPKKAGRKGTPTPPMQFPRVRQNSGDNDSIGDSEARERSAAANEPLRRSSRKAARRFNMRNMDDGEWEQSDNDQSSYSEDSGSGRRDKAPDRRQMSNRLKPKRTSLTPMGISHGSKSSWQQHNESKRKRDFESVQEEAWQLRQQLSASEQLLDQARKREEMAMHQIAYLTNELHAMQASSQGPSGKDKGRDVGSELARRLPNGNLGPLSGLGNPMSNKETEASVAKLMALAQANLPLTYNLGNTDLAMQARNGEPSPMHFAQTANNTHLQAVMRGSSAFSQIPFAQAGMLGFPPYSLGPSPQAFDLLQAAATPHANHKSGIGETPSKPNALAATPNLLTPSRPTGTAIKATPPNSSNPLSSNEGLPMLNGTLTPRKAEGMDDKMHSHPSKRLREEGSSKGDNHPESGPSSNFPWSNVS